MFLSGVIKSVFEGGGKRLAWAWRSTSPHPIPSWGARVLSAAPRLALRGRVLPISFVGSAALVSRGTAAHSAALPRQERRLTMRAHAGPR